MLGAELTGFPALWVSWAEPALGWPKKLTLAVGSMMQSVKNSNLEMSGTVFLLLLYVDVSDDKGKEVSDAKDSVK